MTTEEARLLILFEGHPHQESNEEALFLLARIGSDPGAERMNRLLTALRITFASMKQRPQLDRDLAGALWILGNTVLENVSSLQQAGSQRRSQWLEECLQLHVAVESIFLDTWLGSE